MTLFRKIYKQANDDIKPSEDMINRVILNAHKGAEKRQSPLRFPGGKDRFPDHR